MLFLISFAEASANCPASEKVILKSFFIKGITKTKSRIIRRELNFNLNEPVCQSTIEDQVDRVRRTGLFSNVSYQIKNSELEVSVKEKWTTIPIVKVSSGGGVSQYTLGVYDPNVFGEYLEMGTQYENLEGAGSGVVWFKNPRFLDKNQGIDFQYWNTKRIRIKYDQDKSGPKIKTGFLQEREKIYADYFKEFSRDQVIRFSLDYNSDRFSTDLLSDSVLEKLQEDPILPPSSKLIISKVGLEFGKISGEPYALDGSLLGFYFGYAQPLNSNVDSFEQFDLNYNLFSAFSDGWQLAQRVLIGSTSTDVLQYWHYLGGLDRIRGFADNRFSGRHYGLSNSEVRRVVLQRPSVILQAAGFVDFAIIGEKVKDLNQIHAASVGTGVRLILPQFYRFVLRLDYAKPIIKNDTMNVSLGVQQFF